MKQLVILALTLAYLEVQGQNNFSSTQGYAVSTAASHVASEASASEVKEEKRDQLTGESFRVVEPRGKTRPPQALPHLRAAGPGARSNPQNPTFKKFAPKNLFDESPCFFGKMIMHLMITLIILDAEPFFLD